jgi:uncharacterized protein
LDDDVTTSRRPLRLNLGFLVSAPIGTNREVDFEFERLKVSDDLTLTNFSGVAKIGRTPQGLVVQADFQATLPLECVRCLTEYRQQLHWQFTELYAFTSDNVTESGLLMPEDAHIDLQPLVREYALLEVPINPLCRPECKGLCPVCGENLNQVDCGHRPKSDESPFAALKDLIK